MLDAALDAAYTFTSANGIAAVLAAKAPRKFRRLQGEEWIVFINYGQVYLVRKNVIFKLVKLSMKTDSNCSTVYSYICKTVEICVIYVRIGNNRVRCN